jgi:hypothetical protein
LHGVARCCMALHGACMALPRAPAAAAWRHVTPCACVCAHGQVSPESRTPHTESTRPNTSPQPVFSGGFEGFRVVRVGARAVIRVGSAVTVSVPGQQPSSYQPTTAINSHTHSVQSVCLSRSVHRWRGHAACRKRMPAAAAWRHVTPCAWCCMLARCVRCIPRSPASAACGCVYRTDTMVWGHDGLGVRKTAAEGYPRTRVWGQLPADGAHFLRPTRVWGQPTPNRAPKPSCRYGTRVYGSGQVNINQCYSHTTQYAHPVPLCGTRRMHGGGVL